MMMPTRSILVLLASLLATTACADDSNTQLAASADAPTATEQPADADQLDRAEATTAPDAGPGPGRHGADKHSSDRGHGGPDSERASASDTDSDPSDQLVDLTESDIAGLLWMREEEQLAHDVYTALGTEWGLRIFENIAASETTHIELVAALLDRADIDDPMAGAPAGTFTIPEMQQLYDELVADGRTSLIDALEVGALIEEIDIADLRAQATDIADIQATYDQLERGSRNHLRAFTSQLETRNVIYEPTRLDVAAYEAIVSGEMERGA
jgi:hypothetical protein